MHAFCVSLFFIQFCHLFFKIQFLLFIMRAPSYGRRWILIMSCSPDVLQCQRVAAKTSLWPSADFSSLAVFCCMYSLLKARNWNSCTNRQFLIKTSKLNLLHITSAKCRSLHMDCGCLMPNSRRNFVLLIYYLKWQQQ